ncbi:hypothetical protein NDU88_007355 [Pleurodeles waltl]|uniref:Uncharacterized protein n=1 Tax=Pleurodeles waltl TaxID=8319 RepID=A0AAV7NB93_PLEWA|nr:hypothetical protein NDU88_007355 [Pleurodeles waltl]
MEWLPRSSAPRDGGPQMGGSGAARAVRLPVLLPRGCHKTLPHGRLLVGRRVSPLHPAGDPHPRRLTNSRQAASSRDRPARREERAASSTSGRGARRGKDPPVGSPHSPRLHSPQVLSHFPLSPHLLRESCTIDRGALSLVCLTLRSGLESRNPDRPPVKDRESTHPTLGK